MSQFSYGDYEQVVANAKTGGSNSNSNFTKIGFFKLGKNGASALVRFNIESLADIPGATVHAPKFGTKGFVGLPSPYSSVSCLNKVGDYSNNCPFCAAAAADHPTVGKAVKKCYIQMLVRYRNADGTFADPIPVVWERPYAFTEDLKAKIATFGNLKQYQFLITRIGAEKDTNTRYNIDSAPEQIYPSNLISNDFSAFDSLKLNRHSFWEKSAEDMSTFVSTGTFPAAPKTEAPATAAPQAAPQTAYTAPNTTTAPAKSKSPGTSALAISPITRRISPPPGRFWGLNPPCPSRRAWLPSASG